METNEYHIDELCTIDETNKSNFISKINNEHKDIILLKKFYNDANKRLINAGGKTESVSVYKISYTSNFSYCYSSDINASFVSSYIYHAHCKKGIREILIFNYDYDKYISCSVETSSYLAKFFKFNKNIINYNKDDDLYFSYQLSLTEMFVNRMHRVKNNHLVVLCMQLYPYFELNNSLSINKMFLYSAASTNIKLIYAKNDDYTFYYNNKSNIKLVENKLLVHSFFSIKAINDDIMTFDIPKNAAIIFIWCNINDCIIQNIRIDNALIKNIKYIKHQEKNGIVVEILCTLEELIDILDDENIDQRLSKAKKINEKNNNIDACNYDENKFTANKLTFLIQGPCSAIRYFDCYSNFIYTDSLCFSQ